MAEELQSAYEDDSSDWEYEYHETETEVCCSLVFGPVFLPFVDLLCDPRHIVCPLYEGEVKT